MLRVEPSSHRRATHWLRAAGLCLLCFAAVSISYADKIRLRDCPPEVRETIERNLLGGNLDWIKEIRINDHALYLVEIDLKLFKEAKLHISGDGTLRKTVIEMRFQDLPEAVRHSLERLVKRRGQIEDVEKEIVEGKVYYRVKIKRPKQPNQTIFFEEDGTIAVGK